MSKAFEDFGSSVVLAWRAAGTLMAYRLRLAGYSHGLMMMREQRRFEHQTTTVASCLSSILLRRRRSAGCRVVRSSRASVNQDERLLGVGKIDISEICAVQRRVI
jgi:hypothetical protein